MINMLDLDTHKVSKTNMQI